MAQPRASNLTSAIAAPAQSRATTLQAQTNNYSDSYLARSREEDPIPQSSNPIPALEIGHCAILTDKSKLDIGKDFKARCSAVFLNGCTPTNAKVSFQIKVSYTVDGILHEETTHDVIVGYLDLNAMSQEVTILDKLPEPPSRPKPGTIVSYALTASHPEAESDSTSQKVNVAIHYPAGKSTGNHIENRSVTITLDGEALLPKARFVLCENGKIIKKGTLSDESKFTYKAKEGLEYSVYMVNAGKLMAKTGGQAQDFYELPDNADVELMLEKHKRYSTFSAKGGPNASYFDKNNNKVDPTPAGEYTVEKIIPHVSASKYASSTIAWGEEVKIEKKIFYVKRKGKWIPGTSIHKKLTAEYVLGEYQDLYTRNGFAEPSTLAPLWVLNDFGPNAVYIFNDEDGDRKVDRGTEARRQEMFHTTPDDELMYEDGSPITLQHSHGCIHVDPTDMRQMLTGVRTEKGKPDVVDPKTKVFIPGASIQVHSYDEIFPSSRDDKSAKPPFTIHFFPQAETISIYGA